MPALFTAAGNLVAAGTGHPVAGLRIAALPSNSKARKSATRIKAEEILGEAVSDIAGYFRMTLAAARPEHRRGWWAMRRANQGFVLRVEKPDGSAYLVSRPISLLQASTLTLRLPMPTRQISLPEWSEVGQRLAKYGVNNVQEVVRQLNEHASSSIFADWDVETRHNVLVALAKSFLDPSGVLRTAGIDVGFHGQLEGLTPSQIQDPELSAAYDAMEARWAAHESIASVNWPIDPLALTRVADRR